MDRKYTSTAKLTSQEAVENGSRAWYSFFFPSLIVLVGSHNLWISVWLQLVTEPLILRCGWVGYKKMFQPINLIHWIFQTQHKQWPSDRPEKPGERNKCFKPSSKKEKPQKGKQSPRTEKPLITKKILRSSKQSNRKTPTNQYFRIGLQFGFTTAREFRTKKLPNHLPDRVRNRPHQEHAA